MEKNQLILSVKGLNIQFNLRGKVLHAIRGIDLDIYHGEVLAIVGESGSGKSVFTKSFMGLLDANGSITSGTIDYFGADDGKPIRLSDLKKEKDWLRVRGHEIAMIMQDPMTSLNPLKTIGDQIMEAVELHQGLHGKAAKEKTLEYLRDVGIADPEVRFSQYPHEFSGGMRQRVVIAIAVACNPQILICDEPTTALDVTIQAQILQLLKEMQVKYKLTIVLITHDLGVVADIAGWPSCMPATSWRSAPRTTSTMTPAIPTHGRCCPVCPRWASRARTCSTSKAPRRTCSRKFMATPLRPATRRRSRSTSSSARPTSPSAPPTRRKRGCWTRGHPRSSRRWRSNC